MTLTLEQQARQLWKSWGIYAKAGHCDDCGNYDEVRSPDALAPFLCFDCFRVVFDFARSTLDEAHA